MLVDGYPGGVKQKLEQREQNVEEGINLPLKILFKISHHFADKNLIEQNIGGGFYSLFTGVSIITHPWIWLKTFHMGITIVKFPMCCWYCKITNESLEIPMT